MDTSLHARKARACKELFALAEKENKTVYVDHMGNPYMFYRLPDNGEEPTIRCQVFRNKNSKKNDIVETWELVPEKNSWCGWTASADSLEQLLKKIRARGST